MATPTRYTSGVTTAKPTETLAQFILPDMTKAHVYFNDFDTYTAADWTVTEVGVATQALADGDGGLLLVTNAAADDDSSFNQKVGESFLMETGKKAWFKAKFQVNDATQSDVVIGLQITDTTPLDVTDGIFFLKADGAATVDLLVEKDNTATTTASVATLVDDTDITLGFFYDGVDKIIVFVNDVAVASSVTTNLPDDEALTVSFGVQNGEAVAKTMTLDYIVAAKER